MCWRILTQTYQAPLSLLFLDGEHDAATVAVQFTVSDVAFKEAHNIFWQRWLTAVERILKATHGAFKNFFTVHCNAGMIL